MPIVCTTGDIKFTLITGLDDDMLEDIINGSAETNNYKDIVGYIKNGKFTYPDGSAEEDVNHWTVEFCTAFPDIDTIWIIKGDPTYVNTMLETFIDMENDWRNAYHSFTLWSTPVGYVAVC